MYLKNKMPYIVKSADKTEITVGEKVTYTYTFFNTEKDTLVLYQIEDNIFGTVWSGKVFLNPNESYTVEFVRKGDCTTITNRARARYEVEPSKGLRDWWTNWSNEITVICTMAEEPKKLVVQPNTKETGMDLLLQTQGAMLFEEWFTAHIVKLHKQYEGLP